jgi:hypothetical protein
LQPKYLADVNKLGSTPTGSHLRRKPDVGAAMNRGTISHEKSPPGKKGS